MIFARLGHLIWPRQFQLREKMLVEDDIKTWRRCVTWVTFAFLLQILPIVVTTVQFGNILFAVLVIIPWVFLVVRLLWFYSHLLRGNKRIEFMLLYRRLYKLARQEDFVCMVLTLQQMAILSNSQFSDTLDFVFQKAGTFLGLRSALPLHLPPLAVWHTILKVLDADISELPEYITAQSEIIRKAANIRFVELQECDKYESS